MSGVLAWLVPLLVCPACRRSLAFQPDDGSGDEGVLRHDAGACAEAYPVVDGIPRLLTGAERAAFARERRAWFERTAARRALLAAWSVGGALAHGDSVVRSFDYEWRRFAAVGTPELQDVFGLYFDQIEPALFADEFVVLDAGCGAGRWALEVARHGSRVIAMDLGKSIELARRNTVATGRVACVQADLHDLPLRAAAVDWAYSLGVLHHLEDPRLALARIVDAVRADGIVLLYLYYALDDRGLAYRALFRVVDGVRRMTSRLPRPAVLAFAWVVALAVYWPLARFGALAERAGARALARGLPLSFYRGRSLRLMVNDSLDRFGTRLERRYTWDELAALMHEIGLEEIRISPNPPYWHAIGRAGRAS